MKLPRLVVIGGKLAIICAVSAIVLALVNAVTAPVIVENRARALADGLAAVAGKSGIAGAAVGAGSVLQDSEIATMAYPVDSPDGTVAGYILQLVGTGYGGDLQLLAGYLLNGELFSAQMMENQETPGLGKKAETPEYMSMFVGRGASSPIPTSKTDLPPAEADAITGATITFLGVSRALAEGSTLVTTLDGQFAGGTQ